MSSSFLVPANGVVVPDRQAYSHSASVGSWSPVFALNPWTSSHDTLSTGRLSSPMNFDGFEFMTAFHSACVTSNFPMRNGLSVTSCTGISSGRASGS